MTAPLFMDLTFGFRIMLILCFLIGMQIIFFILYSIVRSSGSIAASKYFFQDCIHKVIFASLTEFYDRQPIGRMLARLVGDMNDLDARLMNVLGYFIYRFSFTISSMIFFSSFPLKLAGKCRLHLLLHSVLLYLFIFI